MLCLFLHFNNVYYLLFVSCIIAIKKYYYTVKKYIVFIFLIHTYFQMNFCFQLLFLALRVFRSMLLIQLRLYVIILRSCI